MPAPHHRRPLPALAAVATAVVASALLVPAASAAPPWSAPVDVGPGGLEPFAVVTGSSGRSLAAGYGSRGGTLVPIGADGAPGRTRNLGEAILGLGVAGDRSVLLRRSGDYERVGVSFGTLDGRSLGRRTLLHRGAAADATLAVGPRGDVLATVTSGNEDEVDGTGFDAERVQLHWSSGAGRRRWRSAQLPGRAAVLATAVDDDGRAVVLLQRAVGSRYAVTARTVRLRTGRFGPERTLAREREGFLHGTAALDGAGGAVVAWNVQDGGEEADVPAAVRAAFLRRGTTTFRPAVTLDPGDRRERPGGEPVAAMATDGSTTVGWTQAVAGPDDSDEAGEAARVATSAGHADRLGPRRDLLASGSVDSVATRGRTTFVAVSGTAPGPAPVPFSGVLSRMGPSVFGAPEQVTGTAEGDLGAIQLGAAPDGFRAVWDGVRAGGGYALRFAERPGR